MKKKYLFIGDTNSINVEIVNNSHKYLRNKVQYIIIGQIEEIKNYLKKIKSNLKIKEIADPLSFKDYDKNFLNIYNVYNIDKLKYKNLLNQIKISNFLSLHTNFDLVTMPINKSIIKKYINFNGMTEYLGFINKKKTKMIMHGENFSSIPLTTHINPKSVYLDIKINKIKKTLEEILNLLNKNKPTLNFKFINFICYNPHCGENSTLGLEDEIIKRVLSKFKKINGPYSSDSAYLNFKKQSLFISTYHDQALIPFKILNKKGINLTIGLDYLRLSPAHGTATDIMFKQKSDNRSYIECMLF